MKSLLISGLYFPPQTGGISNYMASIATALGPESVCCLTGIPSNGSAHLAVLPFRTYRRTAAFAKAKPLQAVGFGTAISEIMLRERPRVVQLATAYDGYMGLWLYRWMNLPFVVYAHGNEILDALNSAWPKPRLALKRAARVLANSRFTAELVARLDVPAHQIEVIHPGCDVDRFQPYEAKPELRQELLGDKAGSRVILSVGNLVARKGHDMVINALPRLLQRMPNLVYLIVGDGPYRLQLEQLAASLGVQQRVVFAGRVADGRLPEVYALSDGGITVVQASHRGCE